MNDFMNHVGAVTPKLGDMDLERGTDGVHRVPASGFRCDHPHCTAFIRGVTDTREQLHALTRRAESAGWQCIHHDGQPMHWCPDHVDPDRQRLRRLYDDSGKPIGEKNGKVRM